MRWLISGYLAIGIVEMVLHALIDPGKGEEKFGLITYQLLHVGCKLAYELLPGQGVIVV